MHRSAISNLRSRINLRCLFVLSCIAEGLAWFRIQGAGMVLHGCTGLGSLETGGNGAVLLYNEAGKNWLLRQYESPFPRQSEAGDPLVRGEVPSKRHLMGEKNRISLTLP